MDLTIQQGDLAFAVARALGSVPQKSAQPLLNCLLLEADKATLRVTGSDLDLTTSVTVPSLGRAPGRVAVNAKHFNEVVRKMPRGACHTAHREEPTRGRLRRRQGLVAVPDPEKRRVPVASRTQGRHQV